MAGSLKFEWHKLFVRASTLSGTAKLVGVALWDYTNADGQNAHPGSARLAQDLGISEKTIIRQLKVLREEGWLVKTRSHRYGGRSGLADVYELSVPNGHPDVLSKDTTKRTNEHDQKDKSEFRTDTQMSYQQIFPNKSKTTSPSSFDPKNPPFPPMHAWCNR